jgi:hypothetical protein
MVMRRLSLRSLASRAHFGGAHFASLPSGGGGYFTAGGGG